MSDDTSQMTKKERRAAKKQAKLEAQQQSQQKSQRNKFLTYGIIAAVVVAIVGFWWFSRVPVPSEAINLEPGVVAQSDWVKGNPQAKVVITEYADFQCPACAFYAQIMEQVMQTHGNEVALVYRHFPLKQIHFQAELAAQAAEAAGKQGKFWEMNKILYARQKDWSQNASAKAMFRDYAEELGLDMNRYEQDLASKETKAKVKANYLNALGLNLSSTPTFFVNGELIETPGSLEEFQQLIATSLGQPVATSSAEATQSAEVSQ